MKHLILFLSIAFLPLSSWSQSVSMEYYFPGMKFDPGIPTPESVIRFVPGEWHVSHDKLVQYMYALAEASPRITIQEIGVSHENRPLLNLVITTAENQGRIAQMKKGAS